MTLVGNMPRFFVDSVSGDTVTIRGNDAYHIGRSLRMRLGDIITVCADRVEYRAKILSISDKEVVCDVLSAEKSENEPTVNVVLYQALPKSDKMDLIVQKAVELGVNEVVPVAMKNCVMKLDEKKADKKIERWQNIAESAAKQSKRTIIPKISHPVKYKQALEIAKELDVTLVPYENERGMEATREIIDGIAEKPVQSIGIIVGPEGGFAPEEIAMVDENPAMQRISLGRRILRTETAGMAALAMLVYRLD